jgi:2-polyprenyl-6-methoxyphenol hydroxylase-like FAD-dependent oxidoreductase
MGYPLAFLQRKDLLQVLFEQLPDESKVRTSKRVYKVDYSTAGVVVHCEDGSTHSGDIVVGADGVHSAVKPLMLQHVEESKPGSTKKDQNSVSAEYSCIFGLGNPVEGVVTPGDSHRSYSKGHSTLAFIGRGGMLYWFLFSRMNKRYFGNDIPKFSKAEMEEAAKAFYNIHMTDSITFEKVWATRTFANMCCVEEATNETWTSGRFVCLGDSIHKVQSLT